MKYLNFSELNNILKENENKNTYFNEINLIFNYELGDLTSSIEFNNDKPKSSITQKVEQSAYGVNIDGKDLVVLHDQFEDSSSPYFIVEKDSPNIVKIISTKPQIFTLIEENKISSKLIESKIGKNKKPFGQYENLNDSLINHLEEAKEKYLKNFNEHLIENLKALNFAYKNNPQSVDKYLRLNNKYIAEYQNLFKNHVEEIVNLYKSDYDLQSKIDTNNFFKKYDEEQKAKAIAKKTELKLKEDTTNTLNNSYLIEKFNYYPFVEVDTKKNELQFIAFNSNHEEVFKNIFPLKVNEIEYYDDKTGIDEVLVYYTIEESSLNSLTKSDHKKYYHSLFDLNDSIIISKNDSSSLDIVASKDITDFGNKDNTLILEKPFSLSSVMQLNYSSESRLKYVEDEMKSKFSSNKLKP